MAGGLCVEFGVCDVAAHSRCGAEPSAGLGAGGRVASRAERWLDEHGDVMYRYAQRRLGAAGGGGHAAEEVVQEAFLAALTSSEGFRGESSERTWLIGILRHKVLDRLRSEGRQRAMRERLASEAGARGGDLDDAFERGFWRESVRGGVGLEAGVSETEREEARRRLSAAIDGLPASMRSALCLREIDGLSSAAVCEILGISATHLSTLVHRAKVRLRGALRERGGGGGDESGAGGGS